MSDPATPGPNMAELWLKAQQQMWRAWADMAATAATGPSASASPGSDPAARSATAAGTGAASANGGAQPGATGASRATATPDMAALAEQWQRLAAQSAALWTAGAAPVARDVSESLLQSQQALFQSTRLMTDAWVALNGQLAAGQDWAGSVDRAAAEMRRQLGALPGAARGAAGDSLELWRLYLEALGRQMGPWASTLSQARGQLGAAIGGDRSAFGQLSRLYWDAWENSIGRLLESPSLGYTRELEERLLGGFEAWMDYRRAVAEYQVVVGEAWAEAMDKVWRELAERARTGRPIASLREYIGLWTTMTDAHMETVFRSEAYAASQGRMLDAAMRYRRIERGIVETFLRTTDLATRSELDEAFREIHALKRELRQLRRERAAAAAAGAGPRTSPDPKAKSAAGSAPQSPGVKAKPAPRTPKQRTTKAKPAAAKARPAKTGGTA